MRKIHRLPVLLAIIAGGCAPDGSREPSANAALLANESTATVLPTPVPPLDREALVFATVRAASAAAAGSNDAPAQRRLDGKPFAVALRFGCPGAGGAGQPNVEQRGEGDNRTVRLNVRSDVSLENPLLATIGGSRVEAVDGFWIARPWLLSAACPSAPPETEEAEEAAPAKDVEPPRPQQRVAIAQFFTSDDTRAGRRSNRPLEAVLTPDESGGIGDTGFNLVLAGRLRALPDGKVISCRAVSPDRPPDCLISAEFDQVWMEHPGTRAILARWAD